jgi:hypothetical protein
VDRGPVVAPHAQRHRARSGTGSLAGAVGASVAFLALLAAGCTAPDVEVAAGDATDLASDEGAGGPDDAGDLDAPPPIEPEDADEAVPPGQDRLRLDLPGAPAGGGSEYVREDLQCVEVNWSGPPDLIDGVRFTVGDVDFSPRGVYEVSTERCPGPHPPCLPDWLSADICTVAVGWTGQPSTEDGELFFTDLVLTCEASLAATCRSFAAEVAATEPRGPSLRPFPDPNAVGGGGNGGGGNGGDGDAGGADAGTGETEGGGSGDGGADGGADGRDTAGETGADEDTAADEVAG